MPIPRRLFNQQLAGFVMAADTAPRAAQAQPAAETPSRWPEQVYRRYSIDIHVPDWDPRLLGRFDAAALVDNVATGGARSFLMYTNSHVGLCLWRSKTGRLHRAMGDRDFFGEVVAECRRRQVHPLAYFSLIYDNWNYESHPDWRIVPPDGPARQLKGRYGVVCPNSPYREYVLACIREIAGGYDIDGMFFDMTFWPAVCYCPHCTARFRAEQGAEPPRVVDWDDPVWRAFQRARQAWLLEFAETLTAAVKKVRPITVNHQYSTVFHNWTFGTPLELARACDYVGGDFYGGPAQHLLACKLYDGITKRRPFEFHTSRTRIFTDHVTVKPMEELRTESFVATLHSAALMLVDYINVDGTLNAEVYRFLGELSKQRAAYEPFLGGEMAAEVGLYFDKESMYNPAENGVEITRLEATDRCPHREAVVGAARLLEQAHIPYGVFTNANLDRIGRYRAVVVPSVLEMTAAQAEVFRDFVRRGGGLYASGVSSLDRFGRGGRRFLLEDVLGVRYLGTLGSRIGYLTPTDERLIRAIWPQDHLSWPGPQVKAEALPGSAALATVTLPFVDPERGRAIGSHFAAIHSNPPGLEPGRDPAIVVNRFGRGTAVWVSAPVESTAERVNANLFAALMERILPRPYRMEVDAHPAVAATLYHQPAERRWLVGLLNIQRDLPHVPVPATVRVLAPERDARVEMLPGREPVQFTRKGAHIEFRAEPFDALRMFLVHYR